MRIMFAAGVDYLSAKNDVTCGPILETKSACDDKTQPYLKHVMYCNLMSYRAALNFQ